MRGSCGSWPGSRDSPRGPRRHATRYIDRIAQVSWYVVVKRAAHVREIGDAARVAGIEMTLIRQGGEHESGDVAGSGSRSRGTGS